MVHMVLASIASFAVLAMGLDIVLVRRGAEIDGQVSERSERCVSPGSRCTVTFSFEDGRRLAVGYSDVIEDLQVAQVGDRIEKRRGEYGSRINGRWYEWSLASQVLLIVGAVLAVWIFAILAGRVSR